MAAISAKQLSFQFTSEARPSRSPDQIELICKALNAIDKAKHTLREFLRGVRSWSQEVFCFEPRKKTLRQNRQDQLLELAGKPLKGADMLKKLRDMAAVSHQGI